MKELAFRDSLLLAFFIDSPHWLFFFWCRVSCRCFWNLLLFFLSVSFLQATSLTRSQVPRRLGKSLCTWEESIYAHFKALFCVLHHAYTLKNNTTCNWVLSFASFTDRNSSALLLAHLEVIVRSEVWDFSFLITLALVFSN